MSAVALLSAIIPALLPAAADGLRGVIARFTGSAGSRPQNVAEVIQLMQADTARLQALAELDRPAGNVSQWVADVRAMQRPAAVVIVLGAYVVGVSAWAELPAGLLDQLGVYAQMVTFYLFGDRSYAYLRGKA